MSTKPAGEFDQVVRLRRRSTHLDGSPVVDALGQAVQPWIDDGDAFARVRHLRGAEAVDAGANTDAEVIEAHIRQRDGVDATWAFAWRGRHWDIQSLLPITGSSDMRLIASSGGALVPR